MKILRPQPDRIQLAEMDPFLVSLLQQLPEKLQSDEPQVKARLFPNPYHDNEELASDWEEHVTPSLAEHFQSASEIVFKDLQCIRLEKAGHYSLNIPGDHLNAWIHTLNQTRITLNAIHDFSEDEMELRKLPEEANRCMDLYLINFYGAILSAFVSIAQGESGEI